METATDVITIIFKRNTNKNRQKKYQIGFDKKKKKKAKPPLNLSVQNLSLQLA